MTKPQKNFLDMIAPSVIKFFTDYFICGNTFRCVWALREYPTSTSEQAILDTALQNVSEHFPQYIITENIVYSIPKVYEYLNGKEVAL